MYPLLFSFHVYDEREICRLLQYEVNNTYLIIDPIQKYMYSVGVPNTTAKKSLNHMFNYCYGSKPKQPTTCTYKLRNGSY